MTFYKLINVETAEGIGLREIFLRETVMTLHATSLCFIADSQFSEDFKNNKESLQ